MRSVVPGLAAMLMGIAAAAPASASMNDQFPCKSGDDMSVLVTLSAEDSNVATLQVLRSGDGKAHIHELRRAPGGSWKDFRYADDGHHVFVGGNGKGVLLMHSRAYACEFAGEPGDEAKAGTGASFVLLDAKGLDIMAPGLTLADGLAFGLSEAEIVARLTKVLGEPGPRDTNDECGGGPLAFRRFGSLSLNFSDGKWVGWMLSGHEVNGVRVTLQTGHTVGSRAGELVTGADYEDDSTLGDEFVVDGISGLSADRGHDAPIESLWAGENCIFR